MSALCKSLYIAPFVARSIRPTRKLFLYIENGRKLKEAIWNCLGPLIVIWIEWPPHWRNMIATPIPSSSIIASSHYCYIFILCLIILARCRAQNMSQFLANPTQCHIASPPSQSTLYPILALRNHSSVYAWKIKMDIIVLKPWQKPKRKQKNFRTEKQKLSANSHPPPNAVLLFFNLLGIPRDAKIISHIPPAKITPVFLN